MALSTMHGLQRARNYLRFERIPAGIWELDGLRGIAILLVLCRHAARPFYSAGGPAASADGYDPLTPLINGWVGVDLFFVLSGFLVTHHVLQRWSDRFSWGQLVEYMVKRFLRIVPTYYAFLLIVAAGCIPYYYVPQEGLGRQLVVHLLFLQDYIPGHIVASFWSLGVEEKFYFLIPFLVLGLASVRGVGRRIGLLGLIACLPIAFRFLTYVAHEGALNYTACFWKFRSPFHLAVDALLIGSVCAYLYRHRDQFAWLSRPWVGRGLFVGGAALVATLVVGGPLLEQEIGWFRATLLFPLLAVGFGAVLLSLAVYQGPWSSFFRSRVLFFFARISYSLYLVHLVFVSSVYLLMFKMEGYAAWPQSVQFLAYFAVYATVSIGAALLLHYLIEKPSLYFKDRYAYRPLRRSSEQTMMTPA